MVPLRRTASAALTLAVAATALGLGPAAVAAKPGTVKVTAIDAVVGSDRAIRVTLKCSAAACAGRTTVKVAGVGTLKGTYRIAPGKSRTQVFTLTKGQTSRVSAKARAATLTVNRTEGSRTVRVARRTMTVRAAVAALTVRSATVTVGHDHVALVKVSAPKSAAVTGTVSLSVAGVAGGGTQVLKLAKGAAKELRFALTDAQVAKLASGTGVAGSLRSAETAPEKVVGSRALTFVLDHDMSGGGHDDTTGGGEHGGDHGDGHGDHDATPVPLGQSSAYARGWNPTQYDTCTRTEHESYSVIGVDGKLYPAWHPPVHTRVDGSTCTFGHEHGDDPRNSDIYDWVIEQYRTENPQANGVPFGYGSEQLTEHANATGINIHRHEDDPGHKVIVANDQKMGVDFTDRWGESEELVCDTLIKAHQGSHSSDATKNNTHEFVYALACNDGSKVLTTVMTNYGNSNELLSSCTRPFFAPHGAARAVQTLGSILPNGEGGARLIPTADCIETYVKNGTESGTAGSAIDDRRGSPDSSSNGWWWAGYEQWQSYTSLKTAGGKEIARFEPWLGLQNPSRYYTGNGASDTTVGYLNDLAWQDGAHQQWSPWKEQAEASATAIDRRSPQAWFNGAIRDAWLTTTKVDNRDAESTVIYTDPWGQNGSQERPVGSIRTYVSRTSNTAYVKSTTPSVINRSVRTSEALTRKGTSAPLTMNFFYDYGRDAQGRSLGVHAPN